MGVGGLKFGSGIGNGGMVVGNGNAEPDGIGKGGKPLGNGNGLGGGGVSGVPLEEPLGAPDG